MTFHKAMTLQEAKSIARHLGLTLRTVRSGDYRVNFRDGNEMTNWAVCSKWKLPVCCLPRTEHRTPFRLSTPSEAGF
jgi:hypothetical protein